MSLMTNFPHNKKRTLYVGGFGEEVNEKVLQAGFVPFGEIVSVSIPLDYETGKHRGFGFVFFSHWSKVFSETDLFTFKE